MSQEIELKFALPPGAVFRPGRIALLRGLVPVRRRLYSVYFDTPAFDLLQAGVALRVRRVGRHWIQTVKARAESVGALSQRPEWEAPVAGPRPEAAALPDELGHLFPAERLARLAPVFSTDFERRAWRVELDEASVELALDRGWVEAGERRQPISELEFELIHGDTAALFTLAEAVMAVQDLQLEPRSKAQRGYQLAGALRQAPLRAARPSLTANAEATVAWQGLMAGALAQVVGNVPGLLTEDDPEYLHQMRVGIRRLRGLVRLGEALGQKRPEWDAGLTDWMQALSPARDWDVFALETLPALWPRRPPARLSVAVAQARATAWQRAREAVTSGQAARLVLAIERDLSRVLPPAGPVSAWAVRLLDRRWRALRRRGRGFDRLDAAARHRLRIAAKRLRYALEPFIGLYPVKRGERALAALADLQDALGAGNDVAVAEGLLDWLAEAGHLSERGRDGAKARLAALAGERGAVAALAWHRCKRLKPFWDRKAGKRR